MAVIEQQNKSRQKSSREIPDTTNSSSHKVGKMLPKYTSKKRLWLEKKVGEMEELLEKKDERMCL
jgi:hypothetical protein